MKEKKSDPLSKREVLKVLDIIGQVYAEQFLEFGIVTLPQNHGDILVKNVNMDNYLNPRQYHFVMENGKRVKKISFNDHSEGKTKRIYWLSQERIKKTTRYWGFLSCRKMSRAFKKQLINKKRYPDFNKLYGLK